VIYRLLSEPSATLGGTGGPLGVGDQILANDRVFAKGWHRLEGGLDRPFRWSRRRAEIHLRRPSERWLTCRVFTGYPEVRRRPTTVRFLDTASGSEVGHVVLFSGDPVRVALPLPSGGTILEVTVDLPWTPKNVIDGSEDARELGIGIQEVDLRDDPGEVAPQWPRSRWFGVLSRLRGMGRPSAKP
jgi:hypothetical protein